jgi:hypothetical protein
LIIFLDGKSEFWVDKVIPEILVTGLELLSIAVVVPDTNVSWAIAVQSVKFDNGIASYIVSLEESGILGVCISKHSLPRD